MEKNQFEKDVERIYIHDGLTIDKTAEKLGVKVHRVKAVIKRLGIRKDSNHLRHKDAEPFFERIVELYQKPYANVASVAKETGVSQGIIRGLLKKRGIKIRSGMERDPLAPFSRYGLDHQEVLNKLEEYRYSYSDTARFFECKHDTIVKIAKKFGVYREVRSITYQTNYFKEINSHEKAYVLGFLAGDGCNNPRKSVLQLTLQALDANHVNKFRELPAPDKEICYYDAKYNGGYFPVCRLTVNNQEISLDLEKLGIVENKTFKLKVEDWMTGEFINSAILGLHDSDGSFPQCGHAWGFCFIGLEIICEFMQKTFKEKLGINSQITTPKIYRENTEKPIRVIKVAGNLQNKTLMDWLYKDSPIFLKRKYDSYLNMLDFLQKKKINPITPDDLLESRMII